jgi:hypothetical protein
MKRICLESEKRFADAFFDIGAEAGDILPGPS